MADVNALISSTADSIEAVLAEHPAFEALANDVFVQRLDAGVRSPVIRWEVRKREPGDKRFSGERLAEMVLAAGHNGPRLKIERWQPWHRTFRHYRLRANGTFNVTDAVDRLADATKEAISVMAQRVEQVKEAQTANAALGAVKIPAPWRQERNLPGWLQASSVAGAPTVSVSPMSDAVARVNVHAFDLPYGKIAGFLDTLTQFFQERP